MQFIKVGPKIEPWGTQDNEGKRLDIALHMIIRF